MEDIFNRYRNIILTTVIAAALFIGYNYFFGGQGTTGPALTSSSSGTNSADIAEQELLSILLQLRDINLDATVFDDELFNSLQDFSQELRPEPVGRNNPFAPIGVGGPPVSEESDTSGEEEGSDGGEG